MPRTPQSDTACARVREQLFLLTTNELEGEDAKEAFTHLAECPDCRQALAEHVKLAAALFGTLGKSTHKSA